MIQPTVGRVVWFWPAETDRSHKVLDHAQPFTASIVLVLPGGTVNLAGFDHVGTPFSAQGVQLWGDDDRPPLDGRFWQWMPYQKGQAARTEQLEAAIKDGFTKP